MDDDAKTSARSDAGDGDRNTLEERGRPERHGTLIPSQVLLSGYGFLLLLIATTALVLDLFAPPSFASRTLSLVLTSTLVVSFCATDIRGLMGAGSTLRYAAQRWPDVTVLAFLLLFSTAKAIILFRMGSDPARATFLAPTYDLYSTVVLIAIFLKFVTKEKRVVALLERLQLKPAQTVACSFALAAILGALLLSLPQAVANVSEVSFLESLFTATSAVCVTGLVVNDIGRHYTMFGQVVILALIQLGALGIMTFSMLLSILSRARIELGEEVTLTEALSAESLGTIRRQVKTILLYTFVIEAVGTLLLLARWITDFPGWTGLFLAVFHAVSAFSNAGFSLFSNSLTGYVGDPLVNTVIALLIVLGGMGFPVLTNLMAHPVFDRTEAPWRLSLHAKMALGVSGFLTVVGFLVILLVEFDGGLRSLPFPHKLLAAGFQSITTRTAGFSTLSTESLAPSTLLAMMILMFIGGSPGSTAGGIKTTTFGTMVATLIAILRGREPIEAFRRTIPQAIIHKAVALSFVAFAFLNVVIFLLLLTEDGSFLTLAFEATSAFGTVGLTTGYTTKLGTAGKGIIIVTMLAGRIGPLSLAVALAEHQAKGKYAYPTERLLVG